MANEPSLSELTSIKGDANQSAAGGNVVLANDYSVQYLQAAAAAKTATNKYIYEKFQENLTDYMTNFNTMSVEGISEDDYEDMTDRYAKLSAVIADNYDVIRNPSKNLAKFSEIKAEEARLRSDIMQSKAQKGMIDEHKKFLTLHPEWNTEANQAKLLAEQKKPMSERGTFVLDAPFTFDPQTYATAAAEVAKKKMATSRTDGKYDYTSETTTYSDADFDEAVLAGLNKNDTFGRASRRSAEDAFNKIPQEERAQYPDMETWFLSTVRKLKPQDSVDKSGMTANQYGVLGQQFKNQMGLQNDAQAHDAWQNSLSRDLQTNLAKLQAETVKGKAVDPKAAGSLKVGAMVYVFGQEGQVKDLTALQTIYGNNTPIKKKRGDAAAGEVEAQWEMKTAEVVAARSINGKLMLDIKNNITGKITRTERTIQQADVEFNNLLGRDKAGMVSDGSRSYLQQEMKMENGNFNLDSAKEYFNYVAPAAGTTPAAGDNAPTISSQPEYDALKKGDSYIFMGKTYIKK